MDFNSGGASGYKEYRPGLSAYTSPRGIRVLVLRLDANPSLTPEWQNEQRRFYTTKDWRREMEGDWSTPAGDAYFPIFSEIGEQAYIYIPDRLIAGPVFRSFDFGTRRPACTWFQYSPKSDRIMLYREFMPHDLLTHEFRDAVRYLSGQLDFSSLNERTKQWVSAYANKPSGAHCPPPWFPVGTRFVDIGGKEMLQRQSNVNVPEEMTVKDIFAAADMNLISVNPKVEGRNRLVGRMLMMRADGYPGMMIDPQCEEIIEGFNGAFAYPNPTEAVPVPTKPKDDGHFINLLDALGYGIGAVVPEDIPKDKPPAMLIGYDKDGRTPIYNDPNVEEVGWNETRIRVR